MPRPVDKRLILLLPGRVVLKLVSKHCLSDVIFLTSVSHIALKAEGNEGQQRETMDGDVTNWHRTPSHDRNYGYSRIPCADNCRNQAKTVGWFRRRNSVFAFRDLMRNFKKRNRGFFTSLSLLRHQTSHCGLQMPADVLDN